MSDMSLGQRMASVKDRPCRLLACFGLPRDVTRVALLVRHSTLAPSVESSDMLRASRLRAAASRVQARRAASVADVELLRDEAGAQRVDSFDAAGFVISGKRWRGGVLTYLDLTLCWRALRLGDVTPEACAPCAPRKPAAQPHKHSRLEDSRHSCSSRPGRSCWSWAPASVRSGHPQLCQRRGGRAALRRSSRARSRSGCARTQSRWSGWTRRTRSLRSTCLRRRTAGWPAPSCPSLPRRLRRRLRRRRARELRMRLCECVAESSAARAE